VLPSDIATTDSQVAADPIIASQRRQALTIVRDLRGYGMPTAMCPAPCPSNRFGRVRVDDVVSYVAVLEDDRFQILSGSPFTGFEPTERIVARSRAQLLTPVAPSKIIGIGANYPGDEAQAGRKHPSLFLMPPSAMIASEEAVVLPKFFGAVLAEGELALVIGKRTRNVNVSEARACILGFTIANDLSGRDSVLDNLPPAFKKGSDGFLPLGPYVRLGSDAKGFQITTVVNGAVMQSGNTRDMIFEACECLSHVSMFMTLEPGDIISLGTPPPKPRLVPGDTVSVAIDGIGTLTTFVRSA